MFFFITFYVVLLQFIISHQKKRHIQQLIRDGRSTATFLSNQISIETFLWDKQNIEDKINIILSNSNKIEYILIRNKKYEETLSFENIPIKLKSSIDKILLQPPETIQVTEFDKSKHRIIHVSNPIQYKNNSLKWASVPEEMVALSPESNTFEYKKINSNNNIVGHIHVGLHFREVQKELIHSRNFFLFLSIPALLVALIFQYLQNKLVTRKLTYLTDAAKKISRGYYNPRLFLDTKDEIGILSQSFKEMVSRLLESQEAIRRKNMALEKTNTQLDEALTKIQNFNIQLEKTVRDRTKAMANLNSTLKIKNRELVQASKAKEQFLGMMTHEFRTPLNAIIGFSQLALKKTKNEIIIEFCREIKGNGKHLLQLINDLLDLTKLEGGHFEIYFEDFKINDIFREIIPSMKAQITEKDLKINSNVSSGLQKVFGDRLRIKQVLINLISNAIKFTISGRIECSASILTPNFKSHVKFPDKFYQRTAVISIKDTGQGISSDDLPRIFDQFKQLDSSETRIQGTGLGLSICKSLMELHQTDIWAWSEKKQGTCMYILIPLTSTDFHYFEKSNKKPR